MKSIKPGRGPSMLGFVMSVMVGVVGVCWTAFAYILSGSIFFLIFGVVFVIMAALAAVYNFKNAKGKNRYSAFDITNDGEEPDPFSDLYAPERDKKGRDFVPKAKNRYCPYCGAQLGKDFEYCNNCGERLP